MGVMADDHRSLRAPRWLWLERYPEVVGDVGRTADLKLFMDWQIDNPHARLGDDVPAPYDFLATFRVEAQRWDLFLDCVPEADASARLRGYMWWRVQHPAEPLPGRRVPPMRRDGHRPACV
jgi:hypothetical protein